MRTAFVANSGSFAVENLEERRLFCSLHDGGSDDAADLAPTSTAITAALAAHDRAGPVVDHALSWYKLAKTVTVQATSGLKSSVPVKKGSAKSAAVAAAAESVSFSTNAAGLPLLTSRADGQGLKIFLDFDGYNTDIPFDLDGDQTTFNTKEQTTIYNAWRDITSYFAMLDVNVTTVQPPTGGSNPNFVWQRITDSVSGGAAYVGWINNSDSRGWTDDSNAVSRTSGIAHEIGHQLNLSHQANWYDDATKKDEYSSGYLAHGPIIGVDYAQDVHKWYYGRNSDAADRLQDDLQTMASYLRSNYTAGTADGFRPDDYGNGFTSATALAGASGVYSAAGVIERVADLDVFSFTSTGGGYDVNLEPLYRSALAPKLEIYSADGLLVAAKDDTSYRVNGDNTGEELRLALPAGTYYVRAAGHGDYGDVGEYGLTVSPLPANWATQNIVSTTGGIGFGGSTGYNAAANTFTQTVGGAGLNGSADEMRYSYVQLTGNGTLTARVDSLTTDAVTTGPRAGLVLRESLTAGGRMSYVEYSPTNTVYGYRVTANSSLTSGTSTARAVGNWLRIVRSGNQCQMLTSADGVTWTPLYTTTFTSLADSVYLGLSTSSRDELHPTTAVFSNVSYSGTPVSTSPAVDASLATPASLTATNASGQSTAVTLNWADTNSGETGYAIERSVDGVNWTRIATTAADAIAYTDNLTFGSMRWWYRVAALSSAGQSLYSASASVVNKPAAPTNFQGVMIGATALSLTWRDVSGDSGYRIERSTDGGVTYAPVATTAANITGYNVTGLTGGTSYTFRITPLSTAGDGVPLIVNDTTALPAVTTLSITNKLLTNVGLSWSTIVNATGYRIERSTDNAAWTAIGTTSLTAYNDNTASALTHYYYRVIATNAAAQGLVGNVVFLATPAATANPSAWRDSDVGTVGGSGAGYIDLAAGTATVLGSGSTTFTSTTDSSNFLYTTLTGDGAIIAKVASLDAVDTLSRAGVMVRNGLTSNAAFVAAYYQSTSGTSGTQMNYRATAGAAGISVGATTDTTYNWVKLVRVGNLFTTFRSATGVDGSWVQIGSATVAMNSTVYVGLSVSSRTNSYSAKAAFTNVSVTTPAPTPAVASAVVNDGTPQRSRVTSITVTFNTPVTLSSGAITLWRRASAADAFTQLSGFTLTPSAGNSVYTLTFPANTSIAGSLPDGLYEIRVAASGVINSNNTAMTADTSLGFYRLFGDIDGDRTVTFNDFLAMQNAFGSTTGSTAFVSGLDVDANGVIDFNDFLALQNNFGKLL